jgi:ComF family protein
MVESATDLLAGVRASVPVPLHRARHRQRGFNQAHDLARHLGLPVRHALRRVRHTDAQATLDGSARWSNVEGAFAVTRQAAALQGAVVVLVDDVRTTGATLEACARALLRAGVAEVRALTAARVAPPSA